MPACRHEAAAFSPLCSSWPADRGGRQVLRGCVSQVCLKYYEHELVELACQCPAVVCCRCSPTQKAHIVKLLQRHAGRRTCAIGECPARSVSRAARSAVCRLNSRWISTGGFETASPGGREARMGSRCLCHLPFLCPQVMEEMT